MLMNMNMDVSTGFRRQTIFSSSCFPILFSAADLFLTLRKKEWEGGSVRICFLLLNWAALLLGAASALNIYLAMQAFVAG